jgi:hypothetical protein
MKKKLLIFLLALSALVPWPVAYAYDANADDQGQITIQAADTADKPGWHAFGNAIGGVIPGDLFYINTGNTTFDLPVTLYMTNTDELMHYYRYLTLNVGIYTEITPGQWKKVTARNGETTPEIYITMLDGNVQFTLPGYAKYKITIDKGCFYCYGANNDTEVVAPSFYISVGS